jgi:DNA-binding transcriptional LysR family regulator
MMSLRGATYNQLVVFRTIVQEGSIRGAARTLEMAPPSVSQALKLLETNIGLTLFHRTTRKITLTDAGRLLHERTSDAISSLAHALESVHELSSVPSGKLRLTLPRFAYQVYLQPIYADFCQTYPGIELEISISDATIDIVREGFDLGIRFGDRIEQGMVARKLTSPLTEAVFVSPDYPETHGTPRELSDLKNHKLIQYRFITSNQLAPFYLSNDGQQAHIEMPTSIIVNDTDLVLDAALKGLGIGRGFVTKVQQYFTSGELIPVLEKHWYTFPGLYLYFAQNNQKVQRVRVLIDYLLSRINPDSQSIVSK